MDGGGRSHSQAKTPGVQDVTSTAGPGVDPMTAQGLTSKPQLQSRSPFISSLRESDLNQQRATQPANSAGRQRQIFQPANPPRSFVTPYSMPPAIHGGHLPPNTAVEDDQLSSRGVLSLDSSGPQSHNSSSSHSSFTSGLSSYSGSSSIDPLINQSATVPPQGGYPAHFSQTNASGSRYNAAGGHVAPNNTGPRLQGQGTVYPHMLHYQPVQYSAMPHSVAYCSGSNLTHNKRVTPQEYPYHSQHLNSQLQQQTAYGTYHSLHYGQPQTQPYNYQMQGGSGSAPTNYYGYNTPVVPHQYESSYPAPAPTPTYHSPYSNSFGSAASSTPYQYQHQSLPLSSVPHDLHTAQSGMRVGQSSESIQSYGGPRNEYAPASIPYHPLQSSSSASSSDWDVKPVSNGYPTHQYPSGVHPAVERQYSPPQLQGHGGHNQPLHQIPYSQYQPPSHAQFSSNFSSSSLVQRPTPSKSAYYPDHGSDGEDDQPQGADVACVSGELGAYGGSGASGEHGGYGGSGASGEHGGYGGSGGSGEYGGSTVQSFSGCGEGGLEYNFEKLKLQSQTTDDKPTSAAFTGKQPPISEGRSSRTSNYSWSNNDDNESERTCSSFLSGGLPSRQEELADKTGFIPKRTIEILEHPHDCTVSLNGTLKLTCRAQIIGSKSEELPDYLWYKDDEPLVGEISGEYVLEKVGEEEGGRYFCLVSHPDDSSSSLKSEIAIVTMKSTDARAPVLISQPEAYVEAIKGEPVVLTVEAQGEGTLRYKWFKGAQELQYCNGNVLRVESATSLDSGQYCCTVSNDYGSVLSDVILVKVVLQRTIPPPITHSSPSRKRYSPNPDDEVPNDRTLRMLAAPVARHTTNWGRLALYLGLMPADAADTQHYQATAEQKAYYLLREWRERKQGTLYALKTILSQAGISIQEPHHTSPSPSPTSTLSSSSSQLPSLSISSHPQDVIVVYGQEAKLAVRTEGLSKSCSYQWYKDGRKLIGKIQKWMIIASTVDSDEGSYTCQISTPEGSIMSHPATITIVSVAPQSFQQPAKRGGGAQPAVAAERRSHPTHLPIPSRMDINRGGGAVYGLTGRGVEDDDDYDESTSQPFTIAAPSIPSSTMPQKANPGAIIIMEQPKSQVASFGSSVSLTCKATISDGSSNDLNYMWYLNGLSLLEHTAPEYRIASFTEEDEGMYSCEVSTLNQSVMSQMASLSVAK